MKMKTISTTNAILAFQASARLIVTAMVEKIPVTLNGLVTATLTAAAVIATAMEG